MRKKLVWAIVVLLISLLLCACETEDADSYSFLTTENGDYVEYTLLFTGDDSLSLTRETAFGSVTYTGNYSLVSENVYRVTLTSSSDENAVPDTLSSITVVISGASFSIKHDLSSAPTPSTRTITVEETPSAQIEPTPTDEESQTPAPTEQPTQPDAPEPESPQSDEPTVDNPTDEPTPGETPTQPTVEPTSPSQTTDNTPTEPEPTSPSEPAEPTVNEPEEPTSPSPEPTAGSDLPPEEEPSKPTSPLDGEYVYEHLLATEGDLSLNGYCKETAATETLTLSGNSFTLTTRTVTTETYLIEGVYEDDYLTVAFLDGTTEDIQAPDADPYNFTKVSARLYTKETPDMIARIELDPLESGSYTYTGQYIIIRTKETSSTGAFVEGEDSETIVAGAETYVVNVNEHTFAPQN